MKHVYYQVRNESPVYVRYRIQDAWGWCTGMIQRDDMRWEWGSGLGTHVYPWLIHVTVWQNQYSIVKQNKVKIKIKKKSSAAMNIGCMYLFELWFSLDIHPGGGLQDHVVALFLVF